MCLCKESGNFISDTVVNWLTFENTPYTLYKLKGVFLNRVFESSKKIHFSAFPYTYNILKWVFGIQIFKFC